MMHTRQKTVAVLLLLLFAATGCGQKGPLYLPGNPSQVQTQIPNQLPTPSSSAEEEEEREDDEYR